MGLLCAAPLGCTRNWSHCGGFARCLRERAPCRSMLLLLRISAATNLIDGGVWACAVAIAAPEISAGSRAQLPSDAQLHRSQPNAQAHRSS